MPPPGDQPSHDTQTGQAAPPPVPPAFPFARTVCACRRCSISCEHLPGALAPSDLPAIAAHLGHTDPAACARESFCVSEGATLALPGNRVITLPTLVPKSDSRGRCIFYKNSRCAIHAVSPFGCSHIDAHMPDAEFTRRTSALYSALLGDHEAAGPYTRTVAALSAAGQLAPPRDKSHASLLAAMRKESLI